MATALKIELDGVEVFIVYARRTHRDFEIGHTLGNGFVEESNRGVYPSVEIIRHRLGAIDIRAMQLFTIREIHGDLLDPIIQIQ